MRTLFLLIPMLLLLGVSPGFTGEGPLVKREIYYDGSGTVMQGYKEYLYDDEGNVSEVLTWSMDGRMQSRYEYRYNEGRLVVVNEYGGGTRLHYSLFEYDRQGRLAKRLEHDADSTLRMVKTYSWDRNGNLRRISETGAGGERLGYREFTWRDGIPVGDDTHDKSGKLLVSRTFSVESGLVRKITFYIDKKPVRVIERQYDVERSGSLSPLGLRDNFHDYR
jgi:hypothetical protein